MSTTINGNTITKSKVIFGPNNAVVTSGYTPPQTNLIGDWNPIASKVLNSSGSTITNGNALSSLTDSSSNADTATQSSSGAMPIWYESDSTRNNKPYIRFNETRDLTNGGVTFLEIQSSFNYDESKMSIYLVMDINHWDSTYDPFTNYFSNTPDDDNDGGFRLGSDSTSYSMNASVSQYPANEFEIKNSLVSPRVVVYKFSTTGSSSTYVNKGGYSSGGSVSYSTDTSYLDFDESRQNLGSDFPKPLLGTGRDGFGSEPYGGVDFNFYRLLAYEECHSDATSLSIVNSLKTEYNTL
tara:strand:+ start:681 stop:1568 length:888 start_codon:yes stop_codon:yes gene_type:complete